MLTKLKEVPVPNRKVSAGAAAGATATLIILLLESLTPIKVDASTAVAISTLLVFVLQYWVPNEV